MNEDEVLLSAIKKVVKSGRAPMFLCVLEEHIDHAERLFEADRCLHIIYDMNYNSVIDTIHYSKRELVLMRSFLKAFFPEKDQDAMDLKLLGWQYHLQQLVLQEDPIKYLEQFLK